MDGPRLLVHVVHQHILPERVGCREVGFAAADLGDAARLASGSRRDEASGRAHRHARRTGARIPFTANTPYANTIPVGQQPAFPGNQKLERRIKSLVRWNALSMVVRANKLSDGIGGHISSYASAATLYEVGFNHFFRGRTDAQEGDIVYFQGHVAPGIYARAFLEGRISRQQLENFRRELASGGGLSSYPHPWLMPQFWQFPTVSMGLGPIMPLSLSYDHRIIDGADAIRFLRWVCDALEQPFVMSLQG